MTHDTLKKTVEDAGKSARSAASDALEVAREEAADVAGRAKSALRSEAEARAEAGKDLISDQGLKLAEKLRSESANDDLQSRILDVVAGSVAEMSEDLRGRSLSSIVDETERFARRHPGAFVAGAAIAGFALARFARASSEAPRAASVPGEWPETPAAAKTKTGHEVASPVGMGAQS